VNEVVELRTSCERVTTESDVLRTGLDCVETVSAHEVNGQCNQM